MTSPSLEAASGRVALALDPSRIGGQDVRRAQLDASLSNGLADVRQLALDSGATTAEASGHVALGTSGESNLTYKVSAGNLTEVGRLANIPDIAGAAVVEGSVSGNRDRLRSKGTLKLTGARYGTTAQALSTRTDFDVAVPALDVAQADVTANTTATLVRAGGRGDPRPHAQRALRQPGSHVQHGGQRSRSTARSAGHRQSPDTGTVDLQLERFAVATPKMTWATPGGGIARIVYTPEHVTVRDLRLTNGPQQIAASGTVGLTNQADAALTLTMQSVDLSQLDDLTVGDRGLAGRLDAKATVAGPLANPVADVELTDRAGRGRELQVREADRPSAS